jgi:hypothetical protein
MRTHQLSRFAAVAAMLSLPACAGGGLGGVGDVLGGVLGGGGAQQGQLVAEIQSVDPNQQAIFVRTQQGETGGVLFDQNTVVVYQQQEYPVTALEHGDIVAMQVQQIDQNSLYTPRIDVQQSVQERSGQSTGVTAGPPLRQLSGQVGQIDYQRSMFEFITQIGTYTVVLPANAGTETRRYFQSLETGEQVTVEGRITETTRIDLTRFV